VGAAAAILISPLTGADRCIASAAGALDELDPALERGTQLEKVVDLRGGAFKNGIADYRSHRSDRDGKGIADAAGLRLPAPLYCRDLIEKCSCAREVRLNIALQKAGEDLPVPTGAWSGPSFKKPSCVLSDTYQMRFGHQGPRNGYAALIRPFWYQPSITKPVPEGPTN